MTLKNPFGEFSLRVIIIIIIIVIIIIIIIIINQKLVEARLNQF